MLYLFLGVMTMDYELLGLYVILYNSISWEVLLEFLVPCCPLPLLKSANMRNR